MRLLLHPAFDRFKSHDLRYALSDMALDLKDAIELKNLGILGVATKLDH